MKSARSRMHEVGQSEGADKKELSDMECVGIKKDIEG